MRRTPPDDPIDRIDKRVEPLFRMLLRFRERTELIGYFLHAVFEAKVRLSHSV